MHLLSFLQTGRDVYEWAWQGFGLQHHTVRPAAHFPNILSTNSADAIISDAQSPPKIAEKMENWRKWLNNMPSDEIAFTKELCNYDKGLGKRTGGSVLALDTVQLRLAEQSTSKMEAINADKTNSKIGVWWTPTVSLTHNVAALVIPDV